MAPGPALMVAKRGPTPKKKDRNCKEQGPRRCFWTRAPQSLKPLLIIGISRLQESLKILLCYLLRLNDNFSKVIYIDTELYFMIAILRIEHLAIDPI